MWSWKPEYGFAISADSHPQRSAAHIDVATNDAEWQAFVVKPDNLYPLSGNTLHIPTLVLNLVMRRQRTIQLAAYTR